MMYTHIYTRTHTKSWNFVWFILNFPGSIKLANLFCFFLILVFLMAFQISYFGDFSTGLKDAELVFIKFVLSCWKKRNCLAESTCPVMLIHFWIVHMKLGSCLTLSRFNFLSTEVPPARPPCHPFCAYTQHTHTHIRTHNYHFSSFLPHLNDLLSQLLHLLSRQ